MKKWKGDDGPPKAKSLDGGKGIPLLSLALQRTGEWRRSDPAEPATLCRMIQERLKKFVCGTPCSVFYVELIRIKNRQIYHVCTYCAAQTSTVFPNALFK